MKTKLNLEDAYGAFLDQSYSVNEQRNLLEEALKDYVRSYRYCSGLVDILHNIDNVDLEESFNLIRQYCELNDIECEVLGVEPDDSLED